MSKTPLILIFILVSFSCFAEEIKNLPDSLKENASVVTKDYHLHMEIKDLDRVTYTVTHIITVLKPKGDSKATLKVFYDDSRKVRYVHGRIYDAKGKKLRKLKYDEIHDVSAISDGTLFSDSRAKVAIPAAKSYPYTVKYKYSVKMKDVFDIPDWIPVTNFGESIDNATLEVTNDSDTKLKFKPVNLSAAHEFEVSEEGENKLKATLKGVKAIEDEPYSPSVFERVPYIRLSLADFEYDGYRGSLKS